MSLNLSENDDNLYHIAFCLVAMGVPLYTGRDVIERISLKLTAASKALDVLRDRLKLFAVSMVQAEATRRKLP